MKAKKLLLGEALMKKLICTLLIAFSLILCACADGAPTEFNEAFESDIAFESSEASKIEDSDSKAESSFSVESSFDVESSDDMPSVHPENSVPTEDIEAIPILFLDTSDHRNTQAYIICAVNEDGFHSTHEFRYNEKHLLDHIDEQGVTVNTNIIDTEKTVTLRDKDGKTFDVDVGSIRCYGEQIIGEVHVCAEIQGDVPTESKRFIGTYSGIDIFPDKLEHGDNSLTVDLDCDGDNEVISWSFTKADDYREDEGNYYYYSLEAIIDGKTVEISDNYDWTPIKKDNLEIFIADVDMDGDFEVIEYVTVADAFNNVDIYNVSADGSEPLHLYTITPEP